MRQLTKLQGYIYVLGAIGMALGAIMYVLNLEKMIASVIYTVGAIAFVIMQIIQTYHGTNITIHRLKSIQIIADILFIIAGLLMLQDVYALIPIPWEIYVQYVHNNWVVVLLIAAIIQLYTTHRIQNEIEKEQKKI